MDEQLRPCPFCGKTPDMTPDMIVWMDEQQTNIECINDNCPGTGLYVFTEGADHERRAIAAWNTRPVEDALRAENERLNAMVELLQTTSRCAWCGAVIAGVSPEHRGELALEHLLTCPSHPLRKLESRIAELTAEVERLRTALRFYADEANWEPIIEHRRGGFIGYGPSNVATDYDVEMPSAAVADYGDRARVALAGEEE